MPITPEISLQEASFGEAPFDWSHARETGNLCMTIGESLGLTGDELWACRAAGYFHDLGRVVEEERDERTGMLSERVMPSGQKARHGNRGSVDEGRPPSKRPGKVSSWTDHASGHALASADLAGDALLGDKNFVATGMMGRVQRVIGQHNIHRKHPPTDAIAIALHDADILEAARFRVFYAEDVGRFEKLLASRYSKLITDFAKNPVYQQVWRKQRENAYAAVKPGGGKFENAGIQTKDGRNISAAEVARTVIGNRK